MTPFGAHIRELRAKRGVTLKQMADELEVSSAYLSALEHGKRGQPSIMLVRQICAYFQIFWDEAEALERLAEMSHPRIVVDTSGLTPKATLVANLLADRIRSLDESGDRPAAGCAEPVSRWGQRSMLGHGPTFHCLNFLGNTGSSIRRQGTDGIIAMLKQKDDARRWR